MGNAPRIDNSTSVSFGSQGNREESGAEAHLPHYHEGPMTEHDWGNLALCAGLRAAAARRLAISAPSATAWARHEALYQRERETHQALMARWRAMAYPLF